MTLSNNLLDAIDGLVAELERQNDKWGKQDHDAYRWMSITAEEFGEAFKALNEDDAMEYRKELIHTAACCLQAVANSFTRWKGGGDEVNTNENGLVVGKWYQGEIDSYDGVRRLDISFCYKGGNVVYSPGLEGLKLEEIYNISEAKR